MKAIEQAVTSQLQGIEAHMDNLVERSAGMEHDLMERLRMIEDRYHFSIEEIESKHEGSRHNWRLPFLILLASFLCVMALAWTKLKRIRKRHLL